MIVQFSGTSRREVLLATLACVVIGLGSARGSFGAAADAMFGRQFVFDPAESTVTPEVSRGGVDLHDGRSRVPARWRRTFEAFAAADRVRPVAAGGVVFVGSSSIALWNDLQAEFPSQNVTQRGLGGATMADCVRHVDRLILPYRPRTVVVYAGDNDLAAGVTPEQVVADYTELVRQVHRELPATRFVFVSIKPSPSREALMPLIRRANALMAAYARGDRQLAFVDIFPAMLDDEAHARRELFRADGLHMTATGYALWHDAIARQLD